MLNTIQQPDFLLSRLISAIGKDDASAAERADIERSLREIKARYQRQSKAFDGVVEQRRLLGNFSRSKPSCASCDSNSNQSSAKSMRPDGFEFMTPMAKPRLSWRL